MRQTNLRPGLPEWFVLFVPLGSPDMGGKESTGEPGKAIAEAV